MNKIRSTLLGQRKLVDRLSVEANICGTSQANLAFVCAEDELDAMQGLVNQMDADHDAPALDIPPITEKLRK